MLRGIKRAGLGLTGALGFNAAVRDSRWRAGRVAILCYHGVSMDDEHLWNPRYFITPAALEQRFRALRERYNVLPLGEAVRRLYERALPPRSAVITFDDGGHDFYQRAFPLLRKYELPATVYLTTYYCRHPKPVFEMFCHYLVWKGRKTYRGGSLVGNESAPDLGSEKGRTAAAAAAVGWARREGLTLEAMDALAEELAQQLGVDYAALESSRILRLMTPEEVAAIASAGIDIQLHTHRHTSPADEGGFAREIADNRRAIREMTGSHEPAAHFCYPSGEYRAELLPWLEREGILSATTCESGLAGPSDHPLLLPRVGDKDNVSQAEWEAWLDGVSEVVRPWLRRMWRETPPTEPPAAR
ncbi:MAG: polysaccharide deacetylase family protein [Bryobacterales bacterium]|nr:polysaccharide deacetylase family protein [Bryobacterales bacterium]